MMFSKNIFVAFPMELPVRITDEQSQSKVIPRNPLLYSRKSASSKRFSDGCIFCESHRN